MLRTENDRAQETVLERIINLLKKKKSPSESEAGLRIAKLIERGSFIRCK